MLYFFVCLQTTWCQNDIKMSSEFQSLICASTAVACDMIYSYFDIGVEFITLSSTGKRELLYIYLVNLIVLMVAQAIAKYELSRQVVILKLDISEALNTVTASYQEKITNSAAILRQDLKYSVNTVNHLRIETGVKEYHTSKNIAEIVAAAKRRMSTHPMEFQRRNVSIFSMGNNPLWNNNTEVNITGDQIIEETTLRKYSTQADDLQDILDVTACLTTQMLSDGTPLSNRSRRRASGFMQTSFFEYNPLSRRRHITLSDIIDDDGEVGWIDDCKVQRCPNRSDGNAVVHDDKTIEGYLQKKRSRGDSFDRCYCVLSHRKVLLFYQRKSKVSLHVSSSIGHFNLNSASEVRISECCLVITVSLNSERKSLIVQAYTSSEGMIWYKGLCRAVYGGHGYGNNIVGDALQNESVYSCCDQQSSTFYRSMIGCNGDYSATESCDMLPIHCGYLSQPQKNIFSSVEYKYCVLRRPGILYGYKSISGANSGGVESGKILVSMCDVLSVVQNNDDKSWFEIAIKDKTIKFEALSEKLATEWCNVIIMWTKYFTVIINASLQSTLTRPLQNNNEGTVSPVFASAVEMVKSRSCNLEKSNCTTDVVVISPAAIEIVNQFYLVKTKTSSFAPSKWQRLWVSTEREGCLTIFAKRPTSHVDDICPQEVVQLSNIIAVDLCTINFCCVHIHEKGFHHEIKSDSLSDAMTLRTNLLSHIVKVHEENKTKAEPQAPLPMLPAVDTKAEIWEVLDSIINNVELDAYGMDAVEIEPFTRESSFFKPLGSGLNPLEVYLNQQSMKARRSIALENHLEFVDMILNPVMIVDKVKESIEASRDRSDSYHDNNQFLTLNSNVDEDTFANKLKTQSYQDLNIEFWARHKWYLTAVVCFVTLNVLTITSYMIRETDF